MKVVKFTTASGAEYFCEPKDEKDFIYASHAHREEIEMTPEAYVAIPATDDAVEAFGG